VERIEQSVDQPSEAVLDSEWVSLSKSEQAQRNHERYWNSARRMATFDAQQQILEEMAEEGEAAHQHNSQQNLGINAVKFAFPRHRA